MHAQIHNGWIDFQQILHIHVWSREAIRASRLMVRDGMAAAARKVESAKQRTSPRQRRRSLLQSGLSPCHAMKLSTWSWRKITMTSFELRVYRNRTSRPVQQQQPRRAARASTVTTRKRSAIASISRTHLRTPLQTSDRVQPLILHCLFRWIFPLFIYSFSPIVR